MAEKKTLTPMQEKFCENVVFKDMTLSDAYRNAYNTENYKQESVNTEACKLNANTNVILRQDEMRVQKRDALIKASVYDYKAHMKELEEIKKKAIGMLENSPTSISTALKATELKGKVSELYNFTQKVDNVGNPQVVVNNNTDAEALNELSSK